MTRSRKDFLDRLRALAKLCREELPEVVIQLYDGVFAQLGYGIGCVAVEEAIRTRRGNDRFPSIADLKAHVVKEPQEIDLANEAVGRIFDAVRLHGWNAPAKAEEYMGDIAWRAVLQFGGWMSICELPTRQTTAARAQLRDSCFATIRLAKAGALNAPTLAQVTGGQNVPRGTIGPDRRTLAAGDRERFEDLVTSTAGRLGTEKQPANNGGTKDEQES